MKPFTHINARSIKEAVTLLAKYQGKAKLNAGGTDLLGVLKERSLPQYPETIVNIKTIPGLDYIREDEGGLKIGALARLAEISSLPTVRERYKLLAEAARSVATPAIRNVCTIGGNLAQDVRCWYYRYPRQLGGPIECLRKGGKICNALAGDNRFHSIFGATSLDAYPCSTHCPADTNIPAYLTKVAKGNRMEAARLLLDFNPLPAVTGRVCPIFCEPECNRSEFDEPVAIRCVERSMGDYILEKSKDLFRGPETESGRTVGILGSGPAGLSAAYYLRRSGHSVTVFERLPEAGGMLLYSIPAYRLPKDVVRKQIQALEGMGIKFEVGVDVGKDVTVPQLLGRFDAVFLAFGAWKERPLGINGERYALSGLEFLNRASTGAKDIPGRKVAVIGGGNVAMDVARTLRRLGAEPVVLYRRSRDEMPAFRDEVEKAKEEGIAFKFLTLPTAALKVKGKIALTCMRMKLGAPDASGRRQPVPKPGSEFTVTFDAVIKAIGEEQDTSLLPLEFRKIRPKGKASALLLGKNLFTGGDFVSGPSTVIEAVASGREGARLIGMMFKDGQPGADVERREPDFTSPSFEAAPRVQIPALPVSERVMSTDVEDTPSLAESDIEREARRCFQCGCMAVNPSDMGTALVALDARIVTTKRTVDAQTFFTASATGTTLLDADEIVSEIRIPEPPEEARQNYLKFTLRKPIDFAMVSVASVITVKHGVCSDARIVLGGVAPTPVRAVAAEEAIKGRPIGEAAAAAAAEAALAGARPLSMNGYKIEIAKTLVKRAILS
jgi:NADPH-dependent glutamate synthase beta subunit-like oxidoreductase